MARVQIEKRKRGFFGWITAILFWGFNAIMIYALFAGLANVGELTNQAATDLERSATGAGAAIGVGLMLAFWAFGAVILGLMMYFTRGRKIIITQET